MKKQKITKLAKKGWKVSTAAEFLGLSKQESEYIELKIALARKLHDKRVAKHLSQAQLAKLIQSSQSRVAKMEKSDPTVSIDLLIKSLLALGSSRTELAKAIT